jgi:hypothetical protein
LIRENPRNNLPDLLDKARTINDTKDYIVTVHGIKGSDYGVAANLVGKKWRNWSEPLGRGRSNGSGPTRVISSPWLKKLLSDLKKRCATTQKAAG